MSSRHLPLVLIKDWAGTPKPGVGEGYRAHLLTQSPYV